MPISRISRCSHDQEFIYPSDLKPPGYLKKKERTDYNTPNH